ncbi:hypothetical protein PDIDSM_4444 [Penicillium digitatum]|nr:hypothetical protein PDIDSM_4444 [Penicillium digitatum]
MTVGVINVVGSSISILTHYGVHINAGLEICVASTKAYTSKMRRIDIMESHANISEQIKEVPKPSRSRKSPTSTVKPSFPVSSSTDKTEVPRTVDALQGLFNVIYLQFMAYWLAVAEGLNVDFPRNLAKSVTIE